MEYNYASEDKSQRIRAAIITVAFSVIVLGIAAWAIIAIVSSRDGGETAKVEETPVAAVVEDSKKEEKVEEQPAETVEAKPAEATETKAAEPVKVVTKATPKAKETVPETGPEELLPLAMVLGMGTAYAFSRKLAKNEA